MTMARYFKRTALVLPFLGSILLGMGSADAGCGTYSEIQRRIKLRAQGKQYLRKTASLSLPGRTLLTAHFAIHYTMMRNEHRPRLVAGDSVPLIRAVDSILQTFPSSWSTTQKGTALHAALDSMGAPPPLYVQRAAIYLERAWSYYADSLGMNMPSGGGSDQYFITSSIPGKFNVDIADITTADPSNGGATYGLTYPPLDASSSASILLENDFLYNVNVDPGTGRIAGISIKAIMNGQVIRDYAADWDLGIKVTVSHEFYHAVQYKYTPDPFSHPHAWYELAATGMEERLAPEVNDYFQYLPCLLQHHQEISLLATSSGVCPLALYGEGIFHQFLTRDLGRAFDVQVWSRLHDNGNDLPGALTGMATALGSRWDTLYASYAASLSAAGRAGSSATCSDTTAAIFLRDLRCWPVPALDTVPALATSKTLSIPSLTFQSIKPAAMGKVGAVSLTGLTGAERVQKTASGFNTVALNGSSFFLFPSPDSSVLSLTVSNSSFSAVGQAVLSSRPQSFLAFPNPAILSNAQVYFFAPVEAVEPLTLTVVSEAGRRVAELSLNPAQASWTWNLKDEKGHAIPPGAYYYRIPGQAAKSLLIMP